MTNDDKNAEQTSRKIKQLTAERDRLRAALEKIVSKAHRGSVWLDIEEVDQVRVALK